MEKAVIDANTCFVRFLADREMEREREDIVTKADSLESVLKQID